MDSRSNSWISSSLNFAYCKIRVKGQAGQRVARIFMTGVTSVSLDSITSGFGIQWNISQIPAFADAVGFTEEEVRRLIVETQDLKGTQTGDVPLARMKDYYNGYRFSPQSTVSVYNASMCLYYLAALQMTGEEPPTLFDPPVATDINKIRSILSLGDAAIVRKVVSAVLEDRAVGLPSAALASAINLNGAFRFDDRDVLSILFFMGYLTFAKNKRNELACPNKAMESQFFEYFFEEYCGAAPNFDSIALADVFNRIAAGVPFLQVGEECGTNYQDETYIGEDHFPSLSNLLCHK